ncbi:MAG: DUF72 domain-containing protein [Planctomycetota bacterium]
MNKEDIVRSLREMADLLEITDANRFEYTAIRSGADAIENWTGDLSEAAAEGTLTGIPSVGKGIAATVTDLVLNGRSDQLDEVRGRVPEELPLLLRFRGLGPKRVRALWQELDIESPSDLETAIREERVQTLKGFGAKTVEKMLASIEYFRNNPPTEKAAPELAAVPVAISSSGRIFAGTSGYSYPQWKGSFYPEESKTGELLSHYSNRLNTVEINNTFYRFPSEKVVEQWMTRTPEDFQFAFKVHRRVTHQMKLSAATRKRIHEFVERCSVLGSRLGCILFQLPPDFERDDQRLDNLLSSLPSGPRFAVEFRHQSWFTDEVANRLTEHNVACFAGDSESDPPLKIATADFIYARLRKPHYSSDELDKWNSWFDQMRSDKRDVLVYLKHDETGDAPRAIVDRWT